VTQETTAQEGTDAAGQPTLRLYNTLTRRKDVFRPLDPANVRMYVCGPTVYDFAHIGNARPVIVFDVLFRLLRHLASQGVWDCGKGETVVTYARNITDVDDKINARARRDYPGLPLNDAIRKVTEATTAQFQADVRALGCLDPSEEPRATDHISGMVAIIGRLLKNGCAYIAAGSEGREVLFDISRMKHYGALSNRKLDEQREGARVAVEAHKKNPGDFVLWKESAADEPGWEAEFAVETGPVTIFGRPGWHIECSAMSMAKLLEPWGGGLACDDGSEDSRRKNTFDIHGGGIDLVFPHHENEIAQSCCALGTETMANTWMHNGFVQVEGRKMSKSEGNFITIDDLLNTTKFGGRTWPGEVLRLAMLKTHYRQPIDWTVRALEEAEKELQNWALSVDDEEIIFEFEARRLRNEPLWILPDVKTALLDDLNFSLAIAALHRQSKKLDRSDLSARVMLLENLVFFGLLRAKRLGVFRGGVSSVGGYGGGVFKFQDQINEIRTAFANTDDVHHPSIQKLKSKTDWESYVVVIDEFDGDVSLKGIDLDFEDQINSLITARNAARAAKDWAESDRIRAELEAMGIAVKDGKDEAGNPVSTWERKR
jgi:cysteinyl-tRNA synthetase